jgi:hypothetical protein
MNCPGKPFFILQEGVSKRALRNRNWEKELPVELLFLQKSARRDFLFLGAKTNQNGK